MTVNLTRIYTRLGDGGETHLGDMSRVPKTHPRIEMIPSPNSHIGLSLTVAGCPRVRRVAVADPDGFDVGADIAAPEDEGSTRERLRVLPEHTVAEERCDEVNATLSP